MTTGDGAGGAAPSNNPCTGNVEACRGGLAAGFGFLAAMRPQLSVCFAAPCSLANHLPHSRAQGVAPQASQLRKGITSGLGMVSSKVQIWQLTVWGKGFERQASAMVSVLVAVALLVVLNSVRPPRTGAGAQAPGRLLCLRCCFWDCPQALEGVWGRTERPRPVDGCVRLWRPSLVCGAAGASEGPKIDRRCLR